MPRKKSDPPSAETNNKETEGASTMDNETTNSEAAGLLDNPPAPENESADVSVEEFSEADFPDEPEPLTIPTAPASNRQSTPREISDRVLTLEIGADVMTQKEIEETIWHELKNSQVSGTPLSGILGKLEYLENGAVIAIVDYKGQRVPIPVKEMMISVHRPAGQSDDVYNERIARALNRMMGAEIDFIVRGITMSGGKRAAVGSRKAAMQRLRFRYYLLIGTNGKPQIYPGRIVEARITAVSRLAIRVEVFGVETSIRNRDLSWGYVGDCREVYFVGNTVQVRVNKVFGDTQKNLAIDADVKSLTDDDTIEKLRALKPQTNCMGKVTDVRNGVIFMVLIDGVRAIAHKCFDKRTPGRGDDVMFVCTHIDEDAGVAQGLVGRIVKRNI